MVVAQLAEQSLPIPEVSGSNPVVVVTQLAERSLPIPEVIGSNLVSDKKCYNKHVAGNGPF